MFAAAPGHPALREMCEHVASRARASFGLANHDTLERTGPGPWTDIVLKHARLHPPSRVGVCHAWNSAITNWRLELLTSRSGLPIQAHR